jgi:omega-amidase
MIKDLLNVHVVQSDLVWENEQANLSHFEHCLSKIQNADLIILPEMFSTGFSMRPELFADAEGRVLNWMKQQATKSGAAICGSVMLRENNKHFNRLYFVQPNGQFAQYDKRHLFTLGKENNHYEKGNSRLIVDYLGWKIVPLICYDLRFPVFSRNDVQYDLLIYVANWPERRANHWRSLLPARAIENQCYLAACNRIGHDGNNANHSGDSIILDFKGDALTQATQRAGTLNASCSLSELHEARKNFPVLQDQDVFKKDW